MPKSPKLGRRLVQLGTMQANRQVLPVLAMELAKAAASGEVVPEDALEVYVDYYKASSRLKTIDPYDNGVKANVSKLRQIIKARDPELLGRVIAIHDKLSLKESVKPLYHSMVEVCRMYNSRPHKVTNAEIARTSRR